MICMSNQFRWLACEGQGLLLLLLVWAAHDGRVKGVGGRMAV